MPFMNSAGSAEEPDYLMMLNALRQDKGTGEGPADDRPGRRMKKSCSMKPLWWILCLASALAAHVAPPRLFAQDRGLVLTIPSDPKSFNDAIAQETSTTQVTRFLFEGLTRMNPVSGQIEGVLADGWEVSGDRSQWVFHLREDVFWSDGTRFSAGDVAFTFNEVIFNPDLVIPARDIFTLRGESIRVEVEDDFHVRFTLPQPFAPFLLALSQPIYPEHILAEAVREGRFQSTWGTDEEPSRIVGTGPFRLHDYVPGEKVILKRNDLYWRRDASGAKLPRIQGVTLLVVPGPEGRLLKFIEGETDIYSVLAQDFPLLKPREKELGFTLYNVGPSMGSSFLSLNLASRDEVKRSWFRNLEFRHALAQAIDIPSMRDVVYYGLATRQCSAVSPSTPLFYNPDVNCPDYDPAGAAERLEVQGFHDRDGDGFREDAQGHPLELVLMTNADNAERVQLAGMVREDLKRIGIRVHLQPLEFNTLVTKLTATGDWDGVLMGLTGAPDPHFGANVWRSDGSLHFWNPKPAGLPAAYENEIDEIFERAAGLYDTPERKVLYDRWQALVAEQLPHIYLATPDVLFAVRETLTGIHPTVLGGVFPRIEEIGFVEPDQGKPSSDPAV